MENSTDILVNDKIVIDALLKNEIVIGIMIATAGLFLLLAFILNSYIPFKNERERLKIEMESAFDEDEYLYWKRELRKFYIRQIPIIGFIINRIKKR